MHDGDVLLCTVPELPGPGVWVGQVRLRVHTDVASVSGSLHRLVFRVRVFSHGEGLATRSDGEKATSTEWAIFHGNVI